MFEKELTLSDVGKLKRLVIRESEEINILGWNDEGMGIRVEGSSGNSEEVDILGAKSC